MWHTFERKAPVQKSEAKKSFGRSGRRWLYTAEVNFSDVNYSQATDGTVKQLSGSAPSHSLKYRNSDQLSRNRHF